ncbi:hypothetical protein KGF56_003941 [Candida oxycetoniae]|uniref:Protein kinase domain-containing protein n=1 Tax=Candida oxycetoniae TaxID=497107 RepID=A0AAI9WWT6_9ASCO|nr:uncharacterized protein KGF56_003941 [Candida oxycetoniae]KAI3403353.2 hypothetical protein KGF56_003941 [Candida oxycetoniae]
MSRMYCNPYSKKSKSPLAKLSIRVPENNPPASESEFQQDEPIQHKSIKALQSLLGEPVVLLPSNNSSSASSSIKSTSPNSSHFERIAQLPTPVLKNGSFFNYSQGQQCILSSPIPRETFEVANSLAGNRILSDYKPIHRVHSLHYDKRVTSNPAETRSPQHPPSAASSTVSSINSNKLIYEQQQQQQKQQKQHSVIADSPITPNTSPEIPKSFAFPQEQKFYSKRFDITFNFVKELGQGNFSHVVLANFFNEEVAVKIITIPDSKSQITNFKSFIRRELNILYHVSYHPCITTLIDYNISLDIDQSEIEADTIPCEENLDASSTTAAKNNESLLNSNQLIFMNYCRGGNLLNFLQDHNQQMNLYNINYWTLLKRIACEIMVTTAFLHENNVVHRDIKLENILLLYTAEEADQIFLHDQLMSTPFINLSDFGLSKKLQTSDQLLQTRCGSQDYISPEILMGLKYDGKLTDTWSIGVLVYCILEGKLPFDITHDSSSAMQPINLPSSGISPSVLKRRRSKKTSTAHRIAMIDWNWNNVVEYLANDEIDLEIKNIFKQLKSFVDKVLVRKDKRPNLKQVFQLDEFSWIKECVPNSIVEFKL